jgi:hypothetical protein
MPPERHALALDATLVTANVDHMIRVPGVCAKKWTSSAPIASRPVASP